MAANICHAIQYVANKIDDSNIGHAAEPTMFGFVSPSLRVDADQLQTAAVPLTLLSQWSNCPVVKRTHQYSNNQHKTGVHAYQHIST